MTRGDPSARRRRSTRWWETRKHPVVGALHADEDMLTAVFMGMPGRLTPPEGPVYVTRSNTISWHDSRPREPAACGC